ncbi:DUF2254 domain-containing protein [Hymenobacter psychrotolerans]|uniref:Uncharacterized membrane protein n=1 Tax=Hymenobacter psychrotolerans DSM 18569 TaxID=1121959 RepID=A0A1M7EXM9_9BACT|nr:DUF2254 domain-containing protein [Hymenobacter psychrotolerans]SHL96542.1 Uncharacterized membrane protein [Hymenobacter psychrotolerans DSM 18569]
MHRLRALWQHLNASLWFVPTLMVAAAIGLAFALVFLDAGIRHDWVPDYPLLFGAGSDGARGMLTAIAGSMVTVAALIFSLTLSTLAQVSSQYTSRVLRNFMRDRANQVVLGFFVSIFVYCLIVLRTIRGGDEGGFIPSLAVLMGLVLALVSIGVLIFFIHHMATAIQASTIIRHATEETQAAIARLFPEQLGEEADPAQAQELLRQAGQLHWQPVPAGATGYVQSMDEEALLALARRLGGVVRLEHGMGGFVARGAALASVARYEPAAPMALTGELTAQLNDCFSLGSQRTIEQDAGFGLRQLVDIALKALSPGINDTTTALIGIDHLSALLAQLADRHFEQPWRTDHERVRVIAVRPTFGGYLATAFDQIRGSADGNVAVYLRLLTALATIGQRTQAPARRQALRQQADLIAEAARRTLPTDYEREQVRQRLAEVAAAFGEGIRPDNPYR